MTATLNPELDGLRPDNPPRRRGAIEVRPRPALSAGVVKHRRGRGDNWWESSLLLPPILRGLGRHRTPVPSWWAIAVALVAGTGPVPEPRIPWYSAGVS